MPAPGPQPRAKVSRTHVIGVAVAVVAAVFFHPVREHVRAISLLQRLEDPSPPSGVRALGVVPVAEADALVPSPSGPIRARTYSPVGVADPAGILLVHGVHRRGIDEPRLVRFARAIAQSGVLVLTPLLPELADYRVDAASIDTIGAAAHELRGLTGKDRSVGVMGMSFAGGLALLAAADARFAADIGFVVTVGAHDDLARVSRFFATNTIAGPDGVTRSMQAHDYGPLVLVYAHIEDFFPEVDVAAARVALRAWLWDDKEDARLAARALSEPSRARMERLFDHHVDSIAPELLAEVEKNQSLMALVSPHGRLGSVHVPVYLLHGAGDSVIPSTETLWLAQDLPPGIAEQTLVSAAINHVELGDAPSWADKWAVVHFLAGVLGQTDVGPR